MATFGTFVAGQVLTAAELNSLGVLSDYTPTWTQSATITKTTNFARYTQLGKLVVGSLKMTASSAGTASNNILVGLPVAASSNNFLMGTALRIAAADNYLRALLAVYESSTSVKFVQTYTQTTASYYQSQIANGDIFYVQFAYEAA